MDTLEQKYTKMARYAPEIVNHRDRNLVLTLKDKQTKKVYHQKRQIEALKSVF